MRKNAFIVILAFITGVASAQQVRNIKVEPKGIYKEIRVQEQNQLMSKLYDVSTRLAAIDSVYKNIPHCNPPVMYTYSQALFVNGEKDAAIEWYLYAQLQAMYDANICADNSAKQAVLILEENTQQVIGSYLKENSKFIVETYPKIVKLFRNLETDYDRRWINLHGLGAFEGVFGDSISTNPKLSVDEKRWPEIKEKTIKEFEKSHQTKAKRFIFPE